MNEIASFTFATWGPEQADRYLADFEDTFELLAKMPAIGRSFGEKVAGTLNTRAT